MYMKGEYQEVYLDQNRICHNEDTKTILHLRGQKTHNVQSNIVELKHPPYYFWKIVKVQKSSSNRCMDQTTMIQSQKLSQL